MSNPYRTLMLGARGEDVHLLQAATNRRLSSRGEDAYSVGRVDGQFGPKTARGVSRALFCLGASESTFKIARADQGGAVSVGAQRMIRHPGHRNQRQIKAGRVRMEHIRSARKSHPHAHGAIDAATRAARLALAHAPEIHYTQGPLRWQGIANKLHAGAGQFPHYADCSAFYTWCLWQMLGSGPDVVNGQTWRGGYTGTLLDHGHKSSQSVEGAAVIYGVRGTTGKHVAYSLGNGQVISHGSEGGPYLLPYNYRSDIMDIRAYH